MDATNIDYKLHRRLYREFDRDIRKLMLTLCFMLVVLLDSSTSTCNAIHKLTVCFVEKCFT